MGMNVSREVRRLLLPGDAELKRFRNRLLGRELLACLPCRICVPLTKVGSRSRKPALQLQHLSWSWWRGVCASQFGGGRGQVHRPRRLPGGSCELCESFDWSDQTCACAENISRHVQRGQQSSVGCDEIGLLRSNPTKRDAAEHLRDTLKVRRVHGNCSIEQPAGRFEIATPKVDLTQRRQSATDHC